MLFTSIPSPIDRLIPIPGFNEPFSAISHLLAAILFTILAAALVRRGRGDRVRFAFLFIYAMSTVLLFSMSAVYHMVGRGGPAHVVFERLDHGAIFVLIAGTVTGVHGVLFHGFWRWAPVAFTWMVAATAITLKTVFFDDLAEWFGLSLYLLLGWLGGMFVLVLGRHYGLRFLLPLLYGGLAYTIGGVIEFTGWLRPMPRIIHGHEIFHVAVIIGALWHWRFIRDSAARPIEASPRSTTPT